MHGRIPSSCKRDASRQAVLLSFGLFRLVETYCSQILTNPELSPEPFTLARLRALLGFTVTDLAKSYFTVVTKEAQRLRSGAYRATLSFEDMAALVGQAYLCYVLLPIFTIGKLYSLVSNFRSLRMSKNMRLFGVPELSGLPLLVPVAAERHSDCRRHFHAGAECATTGAGPAAALADAGDVSVFADLAGSITRGLLLPAVHDALPGVVAHR